jgi:hypothetical protein
MPSDIAAELEAVRDVLRAMSRSQPDLDAVLGSACEHAVKLCGAEFGFVFVPDEMGFRMAGSYGASAQMLTYHGSNRASQPVDARAPVVRRSLGVPNGSRMSSPTRSGRWEVCNRLVTTARP